VRASRARPRATHRFVSPAGEQGPAHERPGTDGQAGTDAAVPTVAHQEDDCGPEPAQDEPRGAQAVSNDQSKPSQPAPTEPAKPSRPSPTVELRKGGTETPPWVKDPGAIKKA
jgi:hypothetical protein